jgi:hypothetical protein
LLERVADDQLIDYVDPSRPYFTSPKEKKILMLYVSSELGLSVSGVFKDGNVGVLEGLNIVAFRKLDIRPSASGLGGSCQLMLHLQGCLELHMKPLSDSSREK